MNKKKLVLLLIIVFNALNVNEVRCQVNVSTKQRIYVRDKSPAISTFSNEIDIPVYGSPYLNQGFNIGSVYFFNHNVLDSVPILFDLLNNEVGYYKASSKDTVALVKEYVYQFKIYLKDTITLFKRLNINAGKSKLPNYQFVEVLYEGNLFSLYKYLYSNMLREKDVKSINEHVVLKQEEKIYLLKHKDFEILELSQNRKILKFFDDKKEEIKKYLETKNLSLKEESSLVATLDYYEKIMASNP